MYKQRENYNFKSHYFLGAKPFQPVQKKIISFNAINKLNVRIKALLIATYASSFLFLFRLIIKISLRLWLIKCCKIQRNNYFGSTNYLYIQRNNYFD